jgi:hypothetical protein
MPDGRASRASERQRDRSLKAPLRVLQNNLDPEVADARKLATAARADAAGPGGAAGCSAQPGHRMVEDLAS